MTPPLVESQLGAADRTDGRAMTQRCIARPKSAAAEASPINDELSARFQRDVIPLLHVLYRRALHMTRQRADAEDLVQDTMLRAYRSFGSFQDGTNVNAWLHTVLTNTYITDYRKKQRRPMEYHGDVVTDQQIAAAAEHSATGLRSAEDEVLEMLPDSRIKVAMQALPEHFRMAVYYADVEELLYREIAQITDAPIGTVMSRVYRGRRQLRKLVSTDTECHLADPGSHDPYARVRQGCAASIS